MTPLDQLKAGIKVANGLTSPSKLILEDWSSYVSRGYFVPNYIEKDRYQAALKDRKENNRMVIGWGGSFAHVNSFTSSGVLDALRRIVEQNKQVEIWIAGDPAVYSLIPVSKYRKRFVPWVHPDGWPSVLTQFDIGLIPLAGQYDRRRSWIKSLEYSIMGIPWVGTDFEPNETFSNYGFTVPNRASKWVSALQICIDNYGWAKELAFEAQAMAESFDVYQNVDNLISTYETIIERAKNGRF
jgi:glycosyltransferase involved in cell wall biosynthesis